MFRRLERDEICAQPRWTPDGIDRHERGCVRRRIGSARTRARWAGIVAGAEGVGHHDVPLTGRVGWAS